MLISQSDSSQLSRKLHETSLEDLMNIEVITSTRIKQKITEAPSTISVITQEQIRENGYEQLEDVLRDIAGVDLLRIHGRAPTLITFRGMYGDENRRILFMIDGIIENSVMGDFALAGPAYSLSNVERIEIILGPGSAMYGANAFGAVINIITKKAADAEGATFQKSYGSYNTSAENIWLGAKKSNVALTLSGSRIKSDGPIFAMRHPEYSNSFIDNSWSLYSRIAYTQKKLKTILGGRIYRTAGGWGEALATPTVLLGLPSQGHQNSGIGGNISWKLTGTDHPSLTETFSRVAFIQNEYKCNARLTLFSSIQYRESEMTEKSFLFLIQPGAKVIAKNITAYYANRISMEINANYQIKDNQQLSAGIQIYQDNLELGFRETIPDGSIDTLDGLRFTNLNAKFKPRKYIIQNNLGSYAQYVINSTFLNKTNFTVGMRYDLNSVYGKTFNPRIGIINQLNDILGFKLLYGTAFRAPTNFERFAALNGYRITNEDLKPERIQTYEANIIFTPFKILSLQASAFHSMLTDIVIQDIPVGNGLTQNQNKGSAVISGIEAKATIFPSTWCNAFMNFTFQDGMLNNGFMKTSISNIARVKGNLGVRIHVAEFFTISIIENLVGDRSTAPTNPLKKVDGYTNTNLVFSTHNLFSKKVSASIIIRNLLNQRYYDPGGRSADGDYYATDVEQPGINGLLKFGISL